MNDSMRLQTLTDQTFELNGKVRELETNMLLLSGACVLLSLLLIAGVIKEVKHV